ncbi:hypothetical protein Pyn_25026 [Prunus yedoensis var. nudiflora]|uniref:Uncharacterized protein n=1 Tax=Prunus yedoensis var. nudiflora TaxID=2094558 RepID=A0A314Z1X1_PRUYE|nr:hypothetical protein Pyn_25026 [Prunus yedoensis var. nudiflora]
MTIAVAAASESEKLRRRRAFSQASIPHRVNGLFVMTIVLYSLLCGSENALLPMGNPFILQPDEMFWTKHNLGSHLRAFLNSPHPLETISDPAAYGSEGRVLHDHDSCNYLKTMNVVLRATYKDDCEESEESLVANAYFTISTLME